MKALVSVVGDVGHPDPTEVARGEALVRQFGAILDARRMLFPRGSFFSQGPTESARQHKANGPS